MSGGNGEQAPRRRAWVFQVWFDQPGLHRGYLIDVVTALSIGTLLVLGGYARTQTPAWDTLNASGGPVLWGAILLALGAALIAATFSRPMAVMVVLVAMTAYYWLIAWWFLVSALPIETGASFVGAVLMARTGTAHLSRAWAFRQHTDRDGPFVRRNGPG